MATRSERASESAVVPTLCLPGVDTQVLDDEAAVAAAAYAQLMAQAETACCRRGRFRLVLAGGNTPRMLYRLLGAQRRDWRGWQCYFSDERCVPATHPERNSLMASTAWFIPAGVPDTQVWPIPAEQGAVAAAQAYTPLIAAARPFDLVLLGMGEDGHTASLFPGHRHPAEALVVPVHDAPKPPAARVSLTPRALTDCAAMIFLICGANKAPALAAWQAGADLPAARVAAAGRALVLLDAAAAGARSPTP